MSPEPQHSEASPQHTPGPWECRIVGGGEVAYIRSVPSDVLLAYIGECALEGDPALITAAPDLLAACKDMREILLGITPMRAGAVLATSAASEAIAKAEGRDAQ